MVWQDGIQDDFRNLKSRMTAKKYKETARFFDSERRE